MGDVVGVTWRGQCTFLSKAERLAAAGATAVVVINSDDRPYMLHADTTGDATTAVGVPVMCVRRQDGIRILEWEGAVTITSDRD